MPKGGDQTANRNAEVKALMEAGDKGNEGGEQKLGTVNEESEGSESGGEAEEPSAAKRELKEGDYADTTEGSEEKDDDGGAASQPRSEADSDTVNPVIYFYENDDSRNPRNGCSFENMCVREMGREHYALVGPTPLTGGALVCAMVALLPGDPDVFGVEDVYVLTRTCVCQMSRGRDMHFAYATMHSEEYTDDNGVSKLTT